MKSPLEQLIRPRLYNGRSAAQKNRCSSRPAFSGLPLSRWEERLPVLIKMGETGRLCEMISEGLKLWPEETRHTIEAAIRFHDVPHVVEPREVRLIKCRDTRNKRRRQK